MAKKINENFNSIAVFLCLLVFHARSIKQKSITLEIKKTCLALWIFYAMSWYRFHFFCDNLKKKFFSRKMWGPRMSLGFFSLPRGFVLLRVCCEDLENTQCIKCLCRSLDICARYDSLCAGGFPAPSDTIFKDISILTIPTPTISTLAILNM